MSRTSRLSDLAPEPCMEALGDRTRLARFASPADLSDAWAHDEVKQARRFAPLAVVLAVPVSLFVLWIAWGAVAAVAMLVWNLMTT